MTTQQVEWNSVLWYWFQIQVEAESMVLTMIFIFYIHLFPVKRFNIVKIFLFELFLYVAHVQILVISIIF